MSLTKPDWQSVDGNGGQLQRRSDLDLIELPPQPERYESFNDLLQVLKKYKFTVAGVALATVLLALIACLLMTPKYQSTATLEVIPDDANVTGSGGGSSSSPVNTDIKTEVATDTKILQDKSMALEVIQALRLEKHRPFNQVVSSKERGLPLDQAPITRQSMLSAFSTSLKVESVPDTRLIQVGFRSPDPVVAANVANTLSDTFIQDYLKRRLQSSSDVSFWMTKELDTLKKKVKDSEQALADYEQKNGMAGINVGSANTTGDMQAHNTVLDRLSTLNQELTTAEANRISAEAVYRLIKNQDPEVVLGLGAMSISSGGSMVGAGGGLDTIRNLRGQEVALKLEYADLSTKYGAKNPRMAELQNQIDAIDNAVKTEMTKITKRAENDFEYAKRNEDAVRDQMDKQKLEADKLTDLTVQLQVLAQEAFSNRNLYQNLFSKLQEASVTQGIHATRLSIVDRAQVTAFPVVPNYPITLGVALCAGLVFGVGVAFVRQSGDDSLVGAMDIETAVPYPVLGHLPFFAKGKSLLEVTSGDSLLISDSESSIAESFRALRTAIVLSRPSPDCKVLLITSPLGADGKTTVAYNLAIAFAQQGARVLLIDGDMRHADLHRHFGVNNEGGLSLALTTRSSSLEGRLIPHAALPNLFLLPAGRKPHLPVELFSLPVFDHLLAKARADFDWVLVDSPPILPVSDASVLSTKVDAVLPVLRSGVTSRTILLSMMKLLGRSGAPTIGLVLNAVRDEAIANFYPYGYRNKEVGDHAGA
jgi:polysaccharide biosynthesis transport protein